MLGREKDSTLHSSERRIHAQFQLSRRLRVSKTAVHTSPRGVLHLIRISLAGIEGLPSGADAGVMELSVPAGLVA
jgi:hypothetical protein